MIINGIVKVYQIEFNELKWFFFKMEEINFNAGLIISSSVQSDFDSIHAMSGFSNVKWELFI